MYPEADHSSIQQIQCPDDFFSVSVDAAVVTVLCSRWQQAWPTSRGWTTSTETCDPPTSWWETTWCARSLTSAWPGSSKTTNIPLGKVGLPTQTHTHPRTHNVKFTYLMLPLTHIHILYDRIRSWRKFSQRNLQQTHKKMTKWSK